MSDIAQRLRDGGNDICRDGPMWPGDDMLEAAAEITHLRALAKQLDEAEAEVTRLRDLVGHLKADRIRINDEAETEIKRLQSTFPTAREEGFRAGRLAGLTEAEIKIADMNAQASSAWVKPTLADQAYIEGRAECVEIIRALKAKQP